MFFLTPHLNTFLYMYTQSRWHLGSTCPVSHALRGSLFYFDTVLGSNFNFMADWFNVWCLWMSLRCLLYVSSVNFLVTFLVVHHGSYIVI